MKSNRHNNTVSDDRKIDEHGTNHYHFSQNALAGLRITAQQGIKSMKEVSAKKRKETEQSPQVQTQGKAPKLIKLNLKAEKEPTHLIQPKNSQLPININKMEVEEDISTTTSKQQITNQKPNMGTSVTGLFASLSKESTLTELALTKNNKFTQLQALQNRIAKDKRSYINSDNYRLLRDELASYPDKMPYNQDIIDGAIDVLGSVSHDQDNDFEIFTTTPLVKNTAAFFMNILQKNERFMNEHEHYMAHLKREKLYAPCISFVQLSIDYNGHTYHHCLVGVSSLGEAKKYSKNTSIWRDLVDIAEAQNKHVFNKSKHRDEADETLYHIVDMGNQELSKIVYELLGKLTKVPEKHNPYATCSEKGYIAQLLKLFYLAGNKLKIRGVINLNLKFDKKDEINNYNTRGYLSINDHTCVHVKGLCPNCQHNRLAYLAMLQNAATSNPPKASYPSPCHLYDSYDILPKHGRAVSKPDALVAICQAIYLDQAKQKENKSDTASKLEEEEIVLPQAKKLKAKG